MKSTAISLIAFLFVIMLFSDTSAQNRMQRHERTDRMIDQLNLTELQKQQIDNLRDKHQEQMIDLRAEQQKAKLENRKLRRSDNLNRSDLLNQTQKMNSIRNKISEARANHFMDVYDILTDEQRKVWKELKSERRGNMDFKRKGFHGRGDQEKGSGFRL